MLDFNSRILTAFTLAILFSIAHEQAVYAQSSADQSPSLNALLATADITAGEQVSHRCTMCHTFQKGESDKIGPNLWNTLGNARAHSTSFNYSDALKGMHNEKWTYDALNLYIANPHKFAPGDKMPFAGMPDPKERANLIAWMRTLSDHPVPLPATN